MQHTTQRGVLGSYPDHLEGILLVLFVALAQIITIAVATVVMCF